MSQLELWQGHSGSLAAAASAGPHDGFGAVAAVSSLAAGSLGQAGPALSAPHGAPAVRRWRARRAQRRMLTLLWRALTSWPVGPGNGDRCASASRGHLSRARDRTVRTFVLARSGGQEFSGPGSHGHARGGGAAHQNDAEKGARDGRTGCKGGCGALREKPADSRTPPSALLDTVKPSGPYAGCGAVCRWRAAFVPCQRTRRPAHGRAHPSMDGGRQRRTGPTPRPGPK